MGLKKLRIIPEKEGEVPQGEGAVLQFDDSGDRVLPALFNPDKLVFSKSVGWKKEEAKDRDVPELQFTNGEPRTLSIDLIFDTYDTPDVQKEDVRKYTRKLDALTIVEGAKHRPPVCRLAWGTMSLFFQGVLERLELQFTLFMEDGIPVRATAKCSFKEWRTNYEDLYKQYLQSSDIVKTRTVKRGETLSSIAAEEYHDPTLWRLIADENGIDDPRSIAPGTKVLLPTYVQSNIPRRI